MKKVSTQTRSLKSRGFDPAVRVTLSQDVDSSDRCQSKQPGFSLEINVTFHRKPDVLWRRPHMTLYHKMNLKIHSSVRGYKILVEGLRPAYSMSNKVCAEKVLNVSVVVCFLCFCWLVVVWFFPDTKTYMQAKNKIRIRIMVIFT